MVSFVRCAFDVVVSYAGGIDSFLETHAVHIQEWNVMMSVIYF